MGAQLENPFGDDVPDNPVKPTYFDPCEGYSPRDKTFKRRPSDGKWIRTDQIEDEQRQKERAMTPQTTTAIAERQPASVTAWPKQQIDLVRRTVAVGATDDELALYLYDCERRGIHPLDKLLHFTKRGGKYTPVTSIDFMRAQAAMSGEMAGSEDPIFQDVSRDGNVSAHPISATVTVYRLTSGQRFAYTATARWSEYCPDSAQMWRKMPHTMLGKCAEALALRKAFPQQLAGLYSSEEMDQNTAPQTLPVNSYPPPQAAGALLTASTVKFDAKTQATDGLGNTFPKSDDGPDLGTADMELPEGFRLIDDYKLDGDWHQVTWGRDAQGGWSVYKTKLAAIGLAAHNAFTERMPVKLHAKKYPFLDKVEKLGSTIPQIKASKFNPDDDRFCDECHRPAAECIC